jgi:NAD(P)-dependent dehydrogenase (short-subunit alcohol dehydrogenase family)
MPDLTGKIALVAGATRGAGRGIAEALGEAGATVWCTGRSARHRTPALRSSGPMAAFEVATRPETVEDTADRVTARGGRGIAAIVDHTDPTQVAALAERIRAEHGGLDLLVDDIWGGDALNEWAPAWELDLERGFALLRTGLHTHLVTVRHLLPLVITNKGLAVEVTDGVDLNYRGTLFFDLVKTSLLRLAFGLSEELRPHGASAVAVTPGFLRSEAMLEHFGVTEANWRDGVRTDPHFAYSESPLFVGRAIAALAADPTVHTRSGGAFTSWGLAREYGVYDADGSRPDWGVHAATEAFGADQRASHARFLAAFGEWGR